MPLSLMGSLGIECKDFKCFCGVFFPWNCIFGCTVTGAPVSMEISMSFPPACSGSDSATLFPIIPLRKPSQACPASLSRGFKFPFSFAALNVFHLLFFPKAMELPTSCLAVHVLPCCPCPALLPVPALPCPLPWVSPSVSSLL